MWQDTIKLGFYSNLVLGNTPDKITLDRVAEKVKKDLEAGRFIDIEAFGLFDSTSPNYTTYYNDVTEEDLHPKDGDFITPTFRALSEVIVHKAWNPVDFSENGVLKASMNLLKGATVNPDHESHTVGNALGAVMAVSWQDAYKMNGIPVPAGILSKLKIDGKSNPRIARGIMMDPPSIHSTSVTVMFLWDKSHQSMADDEFFRKLGTYDQNGKMIRRMATKIKKYPEISLVHHGADPYAMKVDKDGKIVNPAYADVSYNSATEQQRVQMRKDERLFFFDFRTDLIANSATTTTPAESNNENNNNMDFSKQLRLSLGLAETATDQEVLAALTAAITARTTAEASVATLTAETSRLKPIETELTQLKAAQPDAVEIARFKAFHTEKLTAIRASVASLLNKLHDNKPDQATLDLVSKADFTALELLEKTYTTQLEQKFPLSCKKCGSKEVNRASAKMEDPGAGGTPATPKTPEEIANALYERKRKDALPMAGINKGVDAITK